MTKQLEALAKSMCGCFYDNRWYLHLQTREKYIINNWHDWIPEASKNIFQLRKKGKATGIME